MKFMGFAVVVALIGLGIVVDASDRVGVYAVVDKVVFEPNEANPERVQIWGSFAIAARNNRDDYDPVQRGYLYFATSSQRATTRAEWKDLNSLAGSKRIVAFSSRFGQSVRVRTNAEKPTAPDAYVLGIGVNVIQPDRDYAPIKALLSSVAR